MRTKHRSSSTGLIESCKGPIWNSFAKLVARRYMAAPSSLFSFLLAISCRRNPLGERTRVLFYGVNSLHTRAIKELPRCMQIYPRGRQSKLVLPCRGRGDWLRRWKKHRAPATPCDFRVALETLARPLAADIDLKHVISHTYYLQSIILLLFHENQSIKVNNIKRVLNSSKVFKITVVNIFCSNWNFCEF